MKTVEFATLAERETVYWWHVGRLRIIEVYLRRAGKPKGCHILNIGSGTGGTIDLLEQFGVTDNVEISDEAIRYMRQRGHQRITKVTGAALPFADKTYDIIVAFDVLEHIEDEVAALCEWRRVLKDDGVVIATVPAYQWLWSGHDVSLEHMRRYTARRLARTAKQAELQPVRLSYAIVFSLPLIVGFRLLSRILRRPTTAHTSYVDVPAWLNTMFTRFLFAEAQLHEHMSLPVGTTVITTLKKAELKPGRAPRRA